MEETLNTECKSGPTADAKVIELSRTVNSASDQRTVNNVMRHEYRVLTDAEKEIVKSIKDTGLAFIQLCDVLGQTRELSIAKTKMEEAVMWAVKAITR